ncbi:MAG: hypothetical protein ACE5HX_15690 [bacterium]
MSEQQLGHKLHNKENNMVPFREITLTKQQRLKIKDFLEKSNEKHRTAMLFANIIGDINKASSIIFYLEKDYALRLENFAKGLCKEIIEDREYRNRINKLYHK